MALFRSNIDRTMVDMGTEHKPFLFTSYEYREYFLGPVRYYSVLIEKQMDNIRSDDKPHLVKTFDSILIKVLGIKIRYREQFWKYK